MTEDKGTEGTATPDATGGGQQPVGDAQPQVITMSPAQLEARLARERQKFADYDQLRAAKAELDKLQEAQLSELEKAKKQAQEAKEAGDRALAQANDRLIRAAFVAEAAKAGAAHPDDVYHLADLAGVSIGDDGTVTGVAEAVKTLVDGGRLVMSGRPQAPGLDGGAGSGQRASEKPVPLSPEQLAVARKMGLTPEQYRAGMPQTQQQ